ncbi:MAG: prolyl oligopeptidase family serine peptidase [Candidatus Nanopelagicales bacterium]
MSNELPYGTWPSPISALDVARAESLLDEVAIVDGATWWLETRPAEQGRHVLMRSAASGAVEVSPPGWSIRTRLHEYGGRAWTATPAGVVVVRWDDQRLWLLGDEPAPLTPLVEGVELRYAEPVAAREGWMLAVRESHVEGRVGHQVVAVPLDGSAATDASAVVVVADGHDFFGAPRLGPDGVTVSYIAWDHPQMPWDGTVLGVREWALDGTVGEERVLLGGVEESVLQPEWLAADRLLCVSDRSGWWNLHEVGLDGSVRDVCPREEEFAGPTWLAGWTSYALLGDGRAAVLHGRGGTRLGVVDLRSGELVDALVDGDWQPGVVTDGTRVVGVVASPTSPATVVEVDLARGAATPVRAATYDVPPPDVLPLPVARTFVGEDGLEVHAWVHPPRNGDLRGPEGERAPYIAIVHGGPTSAARGVLSLEIAFFTSRGIGVVDVDYGGSTGYGRAYRERLRGQWGIVDVADTITVMRALAEAGDADPQRLVIRGGSAGGWTTLAALVAGDAFAAGVAYYPVADLLPFAEETHEFESRYLDGLIGPLPEALDLYVERSPLTHLDRLRTPVLLLQGADDRVVPASQPESVARALDGSGVPHRLLVFEGEQHGFLAAENIAAGLEAELSFLAQVLGFDRPDVPVLKLDR